MFLINSIILIYLNFFFFSFYFVRDEQTGFVIEYTNKLNFYGMLIKILLIYFTVNLKKKKKN